MIAVMEPPMIAVMEPLARVDQAGTGRNGVQL